MALISVLIDAGRRPGRLGAMMDSIREDGDDAADIEILVIDDGTAPPAGTHRIPPRLVPPAGGGDSIADLNALAAAAEGEFLAFLGDGALSVPGRLTRQAAALAEAPAAPLVFGTLEDPDGRSATRNTALRALAAEPAERLAEESLVSGVHPPLSAMMVRRALWQAIGGLDPALAPVIDWQLFVRAAGHAGPGAGGCVFLDRPVCAVEAAPAGDGGSLESLLYRQKMIDHACPPILKGRMAAEGFARQATAALAANRPAVALRAYRHGLAEATACGDAQSAARLVEAVPAGLAWQSTDSLLLDAVARLMAGGIETAADIAAAAIIRGAARAEERAVAALMTLFAGRIAAARDIAGQAVDAPGDRDFAESVRLFVEDAAPDYGEDGRRLDRDRVTEMLSFLQDYAAAVATALSADLAWCRETFGNAGSPDA